jgi:hypothetical protein
MHHVCGRSKTTRTVERVGGDDGGAVDRADS